MQMADMVAKILLNKERRDLETLWRKWDVTNAGALNIEDLKRNLLALNLGAHDLEEILEDIDINRHGEVTITEFARWYFDQQVRKLNTSNSNVFPPSYFV